MPNPRFTWEYDSREQGFVQKSYFIEVASSEEFLRRGDPDIWSSGKIKTSGSFAVYGGNPLESYLLNVFREQGKTQDELRNYVTQW